jgi:hypothetical protein
MGARNMGVMRRFAAPTVVDASAGRAQKLAAAGGILAAIAASSCCIVPLLLFSLGVRRRPKTVESGFELYGF